LLDYYIVVTHQSFKMQELLTRFIMVYIS